MKNNDTLLNRILNIISDNNIQNYLLNNITTDSQELFFVKKKLQLMRNKSTVKCDVTIFNDYEYEGQPMRGSSSFAADISMTDDELNDKVISAYISAQAVKNPYYKLPMGNDMFSATNSTTSNPLNADNIYDAYEIAQMLYKSDTSDDAFINSAEIFVTHKNTHIVNSNGINVSYSDIIYSGEYVVQSLNPADVELYYDFKYSYHNNNINDSLRYKLLKSLISVRDRAVAKSVVNDRIKLNYNRIIIEGNAVYDLFYYYIRRLDASMIYPGYSDFCLNSSVAPDTEHFDKINITLNPAIPYSSEGIKLLNVPLIKDNIAKIITGDSRFSFYLNIPAAGTYDSYSMKCGNTPIKELENTPYLKIVNFSDFQMNELTGQFGGEYRLAYYFDGTKTIPVTNGSITGNINDIVKCMTLSKESQNSYNFKGPLAVSYLL